VPSIVSPTAACSRTHGIRRLGGEEGLWNAAPRLARGTRG
jgi:hypothetical protein